MEYFFKIWYNAFNYICKGINIMKKTIISLMLSACLMGTVAFADANIPDHQGTSMDGISIGTSALNSAVKSYSELFKSAGDRYGVDPNLLAAICMQESSGRNLSVRDDGTEYPAWGIMQIEYTNEKSFAQFGLKTTGEEWTLADRLDPEKAVPYAAHLISHSLIKYDCDYMKMIQAYNFGETVLNRIIEAKGDDWLSERANAKNYVTNWSYPTYGDAQYIEHVLRYYHKDIDYIGAKVRYKGSLIDFDDQFPIIEEGRTLIPLRAVSEKLGAKVNWNNEEYQVEITNGQTDIILAINSETAFIDGDEVMLDVSAKIVNGRTMVPLRFITQVLGIDISWDQDTRTVIIN